ncbi:hypothetical protein ACIHCQ_44175 [Streptomyces sp. NPDC052236]|uniref:hypothetical protein n=1 Tax=Streptomyces sp. NPDC052236 TaxID=3365686 RepID=UPI0037CF0C53
MQIDHAEQRVRLMLINLDPPAKGPEVVAQRQMPRGLDPAEDSRHPELRLLIGAAASAAGLPEGETRTATEAAAV